MDRIIGTYFSFLDKCSFIEEQELIDNCVEDVEGELLERPEIIVSGKVCRQGRNVGFFSDVSEGYYYSNKLMPSKPLTNNLKELMSKINIRFNTGFNGILINEYVDGKDSIGAHSDDESRLDTSSGILSLSYGATRKFRVKNKITKEKVIDIMTESYDIVHMSGDFQKEFTHEIPKELKVKERRISFTFRKHLQ